MSDKDRPGLSSHLCHLGQCALLGCFDLCFIDVLEIGFTAVQVVLSGWTIAEGPYRDVWQFLPLSQFSIDSECMDYFSKICKH